MLPRTFLMFSFGAVLMPSLIAAAAGQAPARMRFEVMDRNGDGVISRGEWQGSARSFQVHDWNGDGRLAGDEVRIGARRNDRREVADHEPGRAERYLDWSAAGFASLDHNRDSRITANEWHYDLESFRRADRNRDDVLTRAEFIGDGAMDDDREDRFDDLDVNNNGMIETNEWHASPTMFSVLDRNRDGMLSRFEVMGSSNSVDTYDEFSSLDVDRNAVIDRAEWHWSNASFLRRDANSDGRLTRREFAVAGGAPGGVAAAGTRTIGVDARQRWADTMLDVRAGDTISFDARGSITMSTDGTDTATPAGSTKGRSAPDAPVLNQLAGGLIMRIDGYGPIFVGNRRTLTAPVGGRIYLGVNDDHLPDNHGEFTVTVSVGGGTSR